MICLGPSFESGDYLCVQVPQLRFDPAASEPSARLRLAQGLKKLMGHHQVIHLTQEILQAGQLLEVRLDFSPWQQGIGELQGVAKPLEALAQRMPVLHGERLKAQTLAEDVAVPTL